MKPRIFRMTAVAAALGIVAPWAAGPRAGDIDPALAAAIRGEGDVAFIARFAGGVDPDAFPGRGRGGVVDLAALLRALRSNADQTQRAAIDLLQRGGAKRLVQLWSINALAGTAGAGVVEELASLPEVDRVYLDATLAAPSPQPAASATPEWNLVAVGALVAWAGGLTGAGVVIAGVDTGVDALHPDLAVRWRGGSNSWYDPNGEHATPYDRSGHGTQTLSVAVGGDAGGTAIGVAPDAQWIAAKIFNDAGVAELSDIHLAFQWLLDPDGNPDTYDMPDVVNASWGFPDLVGTCFLEFETDLQRLKAAGIAVVLSAGNSGAGGQPHTSVSPADNPSGFAVGAVDSSLTVASTSSRGPSACDGSVFPEVVAPGVGVRTADLTLGGYVPDAYAMLSGTSYAAPHVAGAIALLRQADPTASVPELEQAVTASATDVGPPGVDDTAGYGLIDIPAALQALAALLPPGPVCVDADGDGFYAQANCGTAADCNDANAAVNPAACDVVGDGIDQDCDGVDRLKGKACPVSGGGGSGGGKGKPK